MALWTINRIDQAEDEPAYLRRAKHQLNACDDFTVVVDFKGVEKLHSGDINVLIALNGKLRGMGRELVLVNVPQALMEILEFTRLDRLFQIDASRKRQMA
ncbi:MAG: STAS domain-containing protein [Planctomycetota bacterium]